MQTLDHAARTPPGEAARIAPDLTLLVLARDEAENLRELLPAVRRALEPLGLSCELLVVDGSTTPDAATVAEEHGARVVRQIARGYGQAFREGIAAARGAYIAVIDADLSHDPDVIGRLWDARQDAGVVIASRYTPGASAAMPPLRRLLSRALNAFCRRGLSLPVRDLSSAYRLYRRDAIAGAALRASNFDILEEALIHINADGWEIREVPFHYQPRRHGRSNARLLKFAWSFARTFVRMWQLRNSAFSADYDERAFNSVIPLQRYWQRTRHRLIIGFLDGNTRTLDIGCGSSRIIQGIPYAVGLDIQLKKLRRIQRKTSRVVQATITKLPFASGAFETIICSQVIEHVPYELVDWHEMNRVLVTGGTLIVGTPDYGTIVWPLLERAYGIVHPAGYVHEHINHYTAASLKAELDAHGFSVTDRAYVGGGELIYKARKVRESA